MAAGGGTAARGIIPSPRMARLSSMEHNEETSMNDVTRILDAVEEGDLAAAESLLPMVYAELKRIAAHKMAGERSGHTLQPTALVHEAYLRLAGEDGAQRSWKSRGHFLGAAAEAMRRILIDRARRKAATKRGGDQIRATWDESKLEGHGISDEVLLVDEALQKLERENEELARIVKLRYFAGMTSEEIASALECSPSTVNRGWRVARAWLFEEVTKAQ